MANSDSYDFLVRRDDFQDCKFEPAPVADLEPGQARAKIDAFAFTANNITYAVLGDMLKYWTFFPAPDGFGRIPVWGFADISESRHEAVRVGERFFGYWPMSTELVLTAERTGASSFVDGTAHRKELPAGAFGTARLIKEKYGDGTRLVGLTSPGNRDFVTGLGFYDEVVTYEEIGALPNAEQTVYAFILSWPRATRMIILLG